MNLRRSPAAAIAALAIILGSLSACSSEASKTTCGELKDMSAKEYIQFLKDTVEEEGDDAKDALDPQIELLESIPEGDQLDEAVAGATEAICAGKDDDTELGDIG